MTTSPLILVLTRDLSVLAARALHAVRELQGFGLRVAVAGYGDEQAEKTLTNAGVDALSLPLSPRGNPLDRLAGPALVAKLAERPPALIHVEDESLLGVALFVKVAFPATRIVVEVDGPPPWLDALDRLPDGTVLVEALIPRLQRLSLPRREDILGLARTLSARAIRSLRAVRTSAWVDAWLVRTRAGEAAFESLTVHQAGRVSAYEYGWGVDNDAFLVETERYPIQRAAREALALGPARATVCAALDRSAPDAVEALIPLIDESLARIPRLRWLLFGAPPADGAHAERLNTLMATESIAFVEGYANRRLVYEASDVLVTFDPTGGQGWLMEMSASRAPVLAVNAPRNQLVVRNGESGFLVEGSALDAWLDRLRFFVDRPEQREVMGARARQLAMRLFDSQLMQRRLFRLWDEVLREGVEAADHRSPGADQERDSAQLAGARRRVHDLLDD